MRVSPLQWDWAMSHARSRLTDRLRLEPIEAGHASDLLALYQDADVARRYGRWTREQVEQEVVRIAGSWLVDGVHKWMAYQQVTGECVGRGGLSRKHVDGRERLELGWALHRRFWRRGYATEIVRAGLAFAFGELGAKEVVSFTEVHNHRSRAVMVPAARGCDDACGWCGRCAATRACARQAAAIGSVQRLVDRFVRQATSCRSGCRNGRARQICSGLHR